MVFRLSICICTRNRPDELRMCLVSIMACDPAPFQVIVSDDGDSGRTVDAVAHDFPFVQYQRGPGRGLGANRNACLRSVTGDYVLFIDDDVTLLGDFIGRAASGIQRHCSGNRKTIVSGIEIKHLSNGPHRIEPNNPDFWGVQKVRPRGRLSAIVINSTIFPRDLFEQALFDPQLRYGSEELDMARHAVALGYTIVLEPEIAVDHFPSPVNRQEYKRFVDASRMYATAKAYWHYEKKPLKTLTFVLLAPPKQILAKLRREGIRGVMPALRAIATATEYAIASRP